VEAEIMRITAQSQPRQIVQHDPISKKPTTKKGLMEWLKEQAPSSNSSTAKLKKKKLALNLELNKILRISS
jgi:hypothetical protein